jgi:hypothetical protein
MDPSRLENAGMLIVRAWFQGPDERLVARISQTVNLIEQRATTTTVGTADDLYAQVRNWLEALRTASRDPGSGPTTQG